VKDFSSQSLECKLKILLQAIPNHLAAWKYSL